jgi:uncharacterized protein
MSGAIDYEGATEARKLTVYIGEQDMYYHRPLKTTLIQLFMQEGTSGATAVRGLEGYGASKEVHTNRILDLSVDLPVLVIAIDHEDKIAAALPKVEEMVEHGVITVEKVQAFKPLLR